MEIMEVASHRTGGQSGTRGVGRRWSVLSVSPATSPHAVRTELAFKRPVLPYFGDLMREKSSRVSD